MISKNNLEGPAYCLWCEGHLRQEQTKLKTQFIYVCLDCTRKQRSLTPLDLNYDRGALNKFL